MGSFLQQLTEENMWGWFIDGSAPHEHTTQKYTTTHLWDISEDSGEGKSSQGQEIKKFMWLFFLFRRRSD